MGQYYRVAVGDTDGLGLRVFDASEYMGIDGKQHYSGGKLLEHSEPSSPAPSCTMRMLSEKPMRVAWVGDYSQDFLKKGMLLSVSTRFIDKGIRYPSYAEVWHGEDEPEVFDNSLSLRLDGKFLVNLEAKEYVDCDEYMRRAGKGDFLPLHPLPLLTAVGNGLGGGDYPDSFPSGDDVGSWAWDLLSVADELPANFMKLPVMFAIPDE